MRTMRVLGLQQSRMRDVHARRMQHNALRWLLHLELYLYTAIDSKGRLQATQGCQVACSQAEDTPSICGADRSTCIENLNMEKT